MHVTMVKKRFRNGELCKKCLQAEDVLRRRGLLDRIDKVVMAEEADPESEGMRLAREHGVEIAPFFIVRGEAGGAGGKTAGPAQIYGSVLTLINQVLTPAASAASSSAGAGAAAAPAAPAGPTWSPAEVQTLQQELAGRAPAEILGRVLAQFGSQCHLAFSGAEDVVLIDMAAKSGQPFGVFCLDTGRLHPETYRFLDRVRKHYDVPIQVVFPNAAEVEDLVRMKGLFSFYEDGHHECCQIRKVEPLKRQLGRVEAWVTGQRADQSPATRAGIPVLQIDPNFPGRSGQPLVKCNPLAAWTLRDVWDYIRDNDVPTNELHERGFVSIGCEPCTRAPRPGEHERAGRWWWEEATKRECGLHVKPGT